MDDNKKQNQPDQTANDYQKILDDYAASIKPETNETVPTPDEENVPLTTASLEEVKTPEEPKEMPVVEDKDILILPKTEQSNDAPTVSNKNQFLKDVNSLQLESPIHHSLAANLEPDDVLDRPIQSLTLNNETENFAKNNYQEPPKTPEEIKAEINRILADDNPTDPSVGSTSFQPPKSGLNLFKTFFIVTLVLFLTIAGALAYTLFNPSASSSDSDNTNQSVTPTIYSDNSNNIGSTEVCNLNGKTYKVGDSFASADGCNTCSCESAEVIACTEKACDITPIISTKSATKITTIIPKVTVVPTKTATSSTKKIVPTVTLILDSSGE